MTECSLLGLCAELETSLRRERQMTGIRAAQAKGVHFGRGKALTPAQVAELRYLKASGVPMAELRQRYGLARGSLYRYLSHEQAPQAEAAD